MYQGGRGEVDVSSASWLDRMPPLISLAVVLAKTIFCCLRQTEGTCLLSTSLLRAARPALRAFPRLRVIAALQGEEQLETAF